MGNKQGSDAQSNKSYATVRVNLTSGASFIPGEDVTGHLSVVVVQEIHLGELYVKLKGEAELGIDLVSEHSVVFSKSVRAHKFASGLAKPGTYDFPFKVRLPASAPPSVQFVRHKPGKNICDKAVVAWSLSAECKGSGWFKKAENLHTVPLEVFSSPRTQKPTVTMSATLDAGFLFFHTFGKLTMRATCDRGTYRPGDDCHVTVFLKNASNTGVDLGSVKLDEKVFLKVRIFKREHNENRWALTPRNAASAQESIVDESNVHLKGDHVPPTPPRQQSSEAIPFGSVGHETSLRFSVTLPLNAKHQTMHLSHLRISYALDIKLSPKAIFASPVRLLLPIGICTAAYTTATGAPNDVEEFPPSAPPFASPVVLEGAAGATGASGNDSVLYATTVDTHGLSYVPTRGAASDSMCKS